MPKLNPDRINSIAPAELAETSFGIVDLLQHCAPETQVLSLAVVFLQMTDLYRVTPQELFTVISNIQSDENNAGQLTFNAIKDYVHKEMIT